MKVPLKAVARAHRAKRQRARLPWSPRRDNAFEPSTRLIGAHRPEAGRFLTQQFHLIDGARRSVVGVALSESNVWTMLLAECRPCRELETVAAFKDCCFEDVVPAAPTRMLQLSGCLECEHLEIRVH